MDNHEEPIHEEQVAEYGVSEISDPVCLLGLRRDGPLIPEIGMNRRHYDRE